MDRAACHGSEHPPPPPDRPLAARGSGRKPWHILGENGWRILTENLHHLRCDRLRWTAGAARAPLPTRLATTTATVLGLRRAGRDAPEQRMDRGADLLLHHVADHRHQTSLSRHRFL